MIAKIVHDSAPVLLVGGADLPPNALNQAELFTKVRVAADGGAGALLSVGRVPDAVIGDLDSLSETDRKAVPAEKLHRIDEQDSTDFEKCLMRITAPLVLGLGFLGGRLDHQLAAFHALLRFAHQRCVLLGADELVFLVPPSLTLDLTPGTPVSLFPLAQVTAQAQGLKWSFDALELEPGGRIGTSNEALGPVQLSCDAPGLLCILPARGFETVVKALLAQPGSWSARA